MICILIWSLLTIKQKKLFLAVLRALTDLNGPDQPHPGLIPWGQCLVSKGTAHVGSLPPLSQQFQLHKAPFIDGFSSECLQSANK